MNSLPPDSPAGAPPPAPQVNRRNFLQLTTAAGLSSMFLGAFPKARADEAGAAAASPGAPATFTTELFLDNHLIEETPGVFRRLHPPQKHLLNPVVRKDRWWDGTYFQPYCTMYDKEEKIFKMWMRGGSDDPKEWLDGNAGYTCYLTSADGIHWDKPDLGVLEIAGRRDHNIIFTGFVPDSSPPPPGIIAPNPQRSQGKKGWLWSVVKNPHPKDPSEKFIGLAFTMKRLGAAICTSPDGIHWKSNPDGPFWQTPSDISGHGDDALMHLMYDRRKRKWAIYRRLVPEFSERPFAIPADKNSKGVERYNRSYFYGESDDLKVWKNVTFMLAMDADDPPDTELYNFDCHLIGDTYVGYMSVFHTAHPALVEIHLATSRDGFHWTRVCRGQPFVPTGPMGYFDFMAMCCSQPEPVIFNNTVYLYYAAANFAHDAIHPKYEAEGVGLVTFKRDRYASLQSGDVPVRSFGGACRMVTKPLVVKHAKLFINAATWEGGAIRVEVLTRGWEPIPGFSEPEALTIQGDALDFPVRWKDNGDMSKLLGREIRLKFYLTRARLYALTQDDEDRPINAVEKGDDSDANSRPKLA